MVLNVSGFKLERTLEFDPKFMDPEYPFRWAGVYHLTGEFYDLRLHGVPFPKVKMVMLSLSESSGIDELRDDVTCRSQGTKPTYRTAPGYGLGVNCFNSKPRKEGQ